MSTPSSTSGVGNSAKAVSESGIVTAICDEMRHRWSAGDCVRAESILERDSLRNCTADGIIDVVYSEYLLRRERGERPTLAEYQERFPEHAAALKRQWEFDAMIGGDSVEPGAINTEIGAISPVSQLPFACPGPFGRFILVAPIDSGGQAYVYRAVHPDLGQEVVLKISKRPVSAESAQGAEILAEARTLAAFTHPNIPRVFDAGIESGYPYLVVEYLRGKTLADSIRTSPLATGEALDLVARVARAVAYAHSRGAVHLDIKPKNIVIDEQGEPRLIDFGLARWQGVWNQETSTTGSLSGTLQFMAPEQARGQAERIGEASDVFGLGGVLVFALTGHAPRHGNTFAEVLEKARAGDWDRELLIRENVPREIRRLCDSALQTDPDARLKSAAEFAANLDVLRAGRPKVRWILAAACVLAIAALIAVPWWNWGRPSEVPAVDPIGGRPPVESMKVDVWDVDHYLNLADVAPLKTGDLIRVRMTVPPSMHAGLFLVTSEGAVKQLLQVAPESEGREVHFPEGTEKAAPVTGPTGTEFLVLCGRRASEVSLEEVQEAWQASSGWPALPRLSVVLMKRDAVQVEQSGRDLGESVNQPDPESEVVRRIEQFRQKLRPRFDLIEGWAFSHRKS